MMTALALAGASAAAASATNDGEDDTGTQIQSPGLLTYYDSYFWRVVLNKYKEPAQELERHGRGQVPLQGAPVLRLCVLCASLRIALIT